jgi:hypothetical protein
MSVLDEFELDYRSRRETGAIPAEHAINSRLVEWEGKYC